MIIFGNRKRRNRGKVNGMQHFVGIRKTGRVFHLFRLFQGLYSTSESEIAGRAGILGIFVADLHGFGLLFQNSLKRNAALEHVFSANKSVY